MPLSNAKGSGFERKISRLLTEWVDPKRKGGQPEIFWRSATSGAKATQDHKRGRASEMGGDIVAIHEAGIPFTSRFSVECKNRKTYGKLENMADGYGPLLKWWLQCVEDAERWNRLPLLIFQCHSPLYIMTWGVPSNTRSKRVDGGEAPPHIYFLNQPDASITIESESLSSGAVSMSRLEEWLDVNPWSKMLKIL